MLEVVDLIGKLPVHPTKTYPTRPLAKITRIVVHHTAGPSSQTPESIARFHVKERDWPGIAYHYLIASDGTIYKCWPATTITWCVAGGNTASLCVCLIGDFTHQPPPAAQWDATVSLVRWLKKVYPAAVYGHREVPTPPQATQCPGNRFDCGAFRRAVDA